MDTRENAQAILEEVARVRKTLTPDLLHPRYADRPGAHCYAASEALAHLLRPNHQVEVFRLRMGPKLVHWWLRVDGMVVDPTEDQFDSIPPYPQGVRTGFLTKAPSARAAEILRRVQSTS